MIGNGQIRVRGRRIKRSALLCSALALAAVAGLLVAGSRGVMVGEYALRAPNQEQVALLLPGKRVCEGPVTSPASTQGVALWGKPILHPSRVRVDVLDAAARTRLASGQEWAYGEGELTVRLAGAAPAGRPLVVCVTSTAYTFAIYGSQAVVSSVRMTGPGSGTEFSLTLLKARSSLLDALGTVFQRASLWRPGWVGPWTFWLLTVGLLISFGLGVVAVTSATSGPPRDAPSATFGDGSPSAEAAAPDAPAAATPDAPEKTQRAQR